MVLCAGYAEQSDAPVDWADVAEACRSELLEDCLRVSVDAWPVWNSKHDGVIMWCRTCRQTDRERRTDAERKAAAVLGRR